MKHSFSSALVLGLTLLGAPALAQEDPSAGDTTAPAPEASPAEGEVTGDKLPMPKDGWWKTIKAGEMARYEVTQMGTKMEMQISVDSLNGTEVTFTAKMVMPGGMEAPPQTQTIDASDKSAMNENMPGDAKVTKVGQETIQMAGRAWNCTVYEIEGSNQGMPLKMKMWHCPDLPPIFNNSAIKMEMNVNQGGMEINASMNLVEYTPAGGAAPAGDAPAPKPADEAPASQPAGGN